MHRLVTCVVVVSTALATAGCSFAVVNGPPAVAPKPSVAMTCTMSNWGAGVDLAGFLASAGVVAFALSMADDPATPEAEDADAETIGLYGVGGAVVTGISAAYGFESTRTCRQMREERGEEIHGGDDWAVSFGAILTVGALALSRRGGSAGAGDTSNDPDECGSEDTVTALCRDGTESCSVNRYGTCSWHRGVARWY